LLAVIVFFASVGGIVNNAFRVVHPTAARGMMMNRGAMRPATVSTFRGFDIAARRARFTSDARYDAIRRLVLSVVMLIVAIVVFRRSFDWMNPKQVAAS
jgi:hypothetical protein